MSRAAWDGLRSSYDAAATGYEARFLDELAGKPRDRELLDELTEASRDAGLEVVLAERRAPYPSESERFRLYVEARTPPISTQ